MPAESSRDAELAVLLQSLREAEQEGENCPPVSREDLDSVVSEAIAAGLEDRAQDLRGAVKRAG